MNVTIKGVLSYCVRSLIYAWIQHFSVLPCSKNIHRHTHKKKQSNIFPSRSLLRQQALHFIFFRAKPHSFITQPMGKSTKGTKNGQGQTVIFERGISRHLLLPSKSNEAECYGHSLLPLKTNSRHLFLQSNRAECYQHLLLPLKTISRHLLLPSNEAECYGHSLLPLKTNFRHLILPSNGAECYGHLLLPLKINFRQLSLPSNQGEC